MARVKIKGIEELQKKLNRNLKIQLNKLFRDKILRQKIGDIVYQDIVKNFEMTPNNPSATEKWRRYLEEYNTTHPNYKPTKIKALFTGELLEDLKNNVKAITTTRSFEVAHSEKRHRKYNGKNGKVGSRSPYTEISEGLIDDLGYNYLQLTDKAQKDIVELIREEIFKLLA